MSDHDILYLQRQAFLRNHTVYDMQKIERRRGYEQLFNFYEIQKQNVNLQDHIKGQRKNYETYFQEKGQKIRKSRKASQL